MATKSTNKTVWTLALVAVFAFLAYKLWPAISNAIKRATGGGSSGSGGVGNASDQLPPYYNPQQQGQGTGLSLGGGLGSNGGSSLKNSANQDGAYGAGTVSDAMLAYDKSSALFDEQYGPLSQAESGETYTQDPDVGLGSSPDLSIGQQLIQLFDFAGQDNLAQTPDELAAEQDSNASVAVIEDDVPQISDDGSDVNDYSEYPDYSSGTGDDSSNDTSDDSSDSGDDEDDSDYGDDGGDD